jgi:uncharacterized protein
MEIVSRLFEYEKQSFFLLGPRGTGKSTMIKDRYSGALYIDLLLPDVFRFYLARPERLRETVFAEKEKNIIILDEIQKAPQLLEVVHSIMEEKKGRQFILTGSSARKLKKTGSDMLAGRALMKRMHPFIAAELKDGFDIQNALKYGTIPVVLNGSNPKASLHAYIDLYIREEVQMEGLTRNIGNFARFLEIISFSHGSVLNISNIARECGIERKTVEGFLFILEDLLLAYRLPVFTKRAKRATVQHSKFYFFDTGIYMALRPSGPLDRQEEMSGPALEGLVAQHLRAWIDYRHPDCRLFYWRTNSGNEVDFVVYGKDLFRAIEVKHTDTIHPKDLHGLKSFSKDYPEAELTLLYKGREKLFRDGIMIESCENFLQGLC